MNRAQRWLSAVATALLVALWLVPAWVERPAGRYALLTQERGRSFLLSPPRPTTIQEGTGRVGLDLPTMAFNSATLAVAWLALFLTLRGAGPSLQLLRTRRVAFACVLGALAPVPPFVVPRTYIANVAFLAMGFSPGHGMGPWMLAAGAAFCVTYAAIFYAVLWAVTRRIPAGRITTK